VVRWIGGACAPLWFPLRQPRASALKKKNLQEKQYVIKYKYFQKVPRLNFRFFVDLIELIIFKFFTLTKVTFKAFDILFL